MVNELESIEKTIIESINKYYDTLKEIGYVNQSNVDKLIILIFIGEIINEFPPLGEKDYNALYKLWDCLAQSNCLISWADYAKYSGIKLNNNSSMRIRITDNTIRVANNQIRITHI